MPAQIEKNYIKINKTNQISETEQTPSTSNSYTNTNTNTIDSDSDRLKSVIDFNVNTNNNPNKKSNLKKHKILPEITKSAKQNKSYSKINIIKKQPNYLFASKKIQQSSITKRNIVNNKKLELLLQKNEVKIDIKNKLVQLNDYTNHIEIKNNNFNEIKNYRKNITYNKNLSNENKNNLKDTNKILKSLKKFDENHLNNKSKFF